MTKIDIAVNGQPVKPQDAPKPKEDPWGMVFGLGLILLVCVGWLYQLSVR